MMYTTAEIKGHPILGSVKDLRADSLGFIRRCSSMADIVQFRLGMKRVYGLHHPELVREVMSVSSDVFAKKGIYQRMAPVFRKGLLTSHGDFWKKQRRMIQPAFARQHLDQMAVTIRREVQQFRDEWVARPGASVDIYELMLDISLRLISSTMFSVDVRKDHKSISGHVYNLNRYVNKLIYDLVPIPAFVPTASNRSFRRSMKYFDELILGMVESRLKSGNPGSDLLGMLLTARDPETEKPMSLTQIRDEALTFLIAGHETTATALSWAYYLLDRNPGVKAEMYRVIDSQAGAGELQDGSKQPGLGYLDDVFKESIRMRPPSWFLYRHVTRDIKLGDVQLKRGDTIYVSSLVTHMDERFWEDPETFNPGRFAAANPSHKFAFFPFGSGPRTCIGANFAMLESRMILSILGRQIDFQLEDDGPVAAEPLVSLKPSTPLRMRVVLREPSRSAGSGEAPADGGELDDGCQRGDA